MLTTVAPLRSNINGRRWRIPGSCQSPAGEVVPDELTTANARVKLASQYPQFP